MSNLSASRAPTAPRPLGSSSGRRYRPMLGLATVLACLTLAGPVTADVAWTEPAADRTLGAIAPGPVADAVGETDSRRRHAAGPFAKPQPLAPAPPADGRDAPDPFILADPGGYLLYSTQVGWQNVPVAVSADLRQWSAPVDALPQLPAWAAWGRTWAPGVLRLDSRYLLFFTALHHLTGRQCIGVATSRAATGPFTSSAAEPLVCQAELGGSIDPHPFVDHDGTAYLTWKSDGNALGQTSQLFAQRLAPDGLTLEGDATPLLRNDADWEAPLIENPALVAVPDGSYLLMYSGGWWESAGYAIGYGTCDSPLGPCTKATTDRPLAASAGEQAGPGGACVVTGPAGDQWLAYHAWTVGAVGYDAAGARSLRFAALMWRDGRPVVGR